MTRFWHANCMTSFRGHRRPLIGRNPKYFTLDFTTHQDHISIDRLKPAIFSTESLNKAPQAPFPHTSCLTKSPDRLAHAHPRTQMDLLMTALIKTIQNRDTHFGGDVQRYTFLRVSKIMS